MWLRVKTFLVVSVVTLGIAFTGTCPARADDAVQSSSDIQGAQQALIALGYDIGIADGTIGPKTRTALRAFQAKSGIYASGRLNDATVTALNADVLSTANAPAAEPTPGAQANDMPDASSTAAAWLVLVVTCFVVWRFTRKRSTKVAHTAQSAAPVTSVVYGDAVNAGTSSTSVRQTIKLNTRNTCWVPFGKDVVVAGHTIRGGMLYVGAALVQNDGHSTENCLINPAQKVATSGSNHAGTNMPYWPSYSFLEPRSKLAYLNWLETGRNDPTAYIGYVFLYFYGLERRLMLEDPGAEAVHIIAEVKRLLEIYYDNHSFNGYARALLAAATMKFNQVFEWPALDITRRCWQMPLDLALCIGRAIAQGTALNAEQLIAWYDAHPEKRLPPAARKCPNEFLTLFKTKFAEKFPSGIKVAKPKRTLSGSYRAASATFTVTVQPSPPCPDISGLSAPLTQIEPLIEACATELSAYARIIGREAASRNVVAAAASLPEQLRNTTAAQPLNELASWLGENVPSGQAVLNLPKLLSHVGVSLGPARKLTKADMVLAAEALARCNYGIEPDPRNTYPSPALTGTAVVFAAENGARLLQVRPEFLSALTQIDIGMLVAAADDVVAAVETQTLEEAVARNMGLSSVEKMRLTARIAFLAKNPPSTRLLSQFKDRTLSEREAVARLAIAVAASDGIMAPNELKLLEKIYKALELPVQRLYSDVQGLTAQDEYIPIVATADPSTAVPIPRRPSAAAPQAIALDAARLARTRADTAVVCSILGDIFRDENDDGGGNLAATAQSGVPTIAASSLTSKGSFPGLDPKYVPLIDALSGHPRMSWSDFDMLARQHDLLCDGAIEAINDWSYTKFDAPLLDDGPEIAINSELLAQGRAA